MDAKQFVEAIDEMPQKIARENFEALMCLALSIEETEQEEQQANEANRSTEVLAIC